MRIPGAAIRCSPSGRGPRGRTSEQVGDRHKIGKEPAAMQGATTISRPRPTGPDPLPPPGVAPDWSDLGTERLLVSIATYNEHDNLAPLIEAIHAELPAADVLVID